MSERRAWLITGASSGFGRALVGAALDFDEPPLRPVRGADAISTETA